MKQLASEELTPVFLPQRQLAIGSVIPSFLALFRFDFCAFTILVLQRVSMIVSPVSDLKKIISYAFSDRREE